MVDFKVETRKRCRHCKMKLPTPTGNEREAFCTRGCYNSFYLHRCRVCEKSIERTTANRKICKRSKCRNALKAGEGFGRYHADSAQTTRASKNPELMQNPLISCGSASASNTPDRTNTAYAERPRRIAAGRLTINQYHRAVVGDAPDPNGGLPTIPYAKVWADGDWQATENRNRKLLEKHFARLRVAAEDRTPPILVTAINAERVASLVATIPDDLTVPRFLDRRPLPASAPPSGSSGASLLCSTSSAIGIFAGDTRNNRAGTATRSPDSLVLAWTAKTLLNPRNKGCCGS
jgi:hypothetical protein